MSTDDDSSDGVRLHFGPGRRKLRHRFEMGRDGGDRRERREIHFESARIEYLRHETNICDRKRVGMTEAACRRMTAQLRLEPRETFDDPVPIPRIHVRLVLPEAISQI